MGQYSRARNFSIGNDAGGGLNYCLLLYFGGKQYLLFWSHLLNIKSFDPATKFSQATGKKEKAKFTFSMSEELKTL